MGNKKKINNLKDYAELAWASYFYFDLDECVLKENDIKITTNEIISLSYNGKMAGEKEKILVKRNSMVNLVKFRLKTLLKDIRFIFINPIP